MSERVTPDELRDTAAMSSAHVEDRGLCRRCLLRWPCDAVVARDALTAAADRIVQRAVELDAALAARLDAAAKERTVSKRWLMERLISDGLDRGRATDHS